VHTKKHKVWLQIRSQPPMTSCSEGESGRRHVSACSLLMMQCPRADCHVTALPYMHLHGLESNCGV
jgi:hypothetical protein